MNIENEDFIPLLCGSFAKSSLRVSTNPSFGGSTISAISQYHLLISCRVQSGRPFRSKTSGDNGGVDMDKYIISGSDAEACAELLLFSWHRCEVIIMNVLSLRRANVFF